MQCWKGKHCWHVPFLKRDDNPQVLRVKVLEHVKKLQCKQNYLLRSITHSYSCFTMLHPINDSKHLSDLWFDNCFNLFIGDQMAQKVPTLYILAVSHCSQFNNNRKGYEIHWQLNQQNQSNVQLRKYACWSLPNKHRKQMQLKIQ